MAFDSTVDIANQDVYVERRSEESMTEISGTKKGEHNLIVYPSLEYFRRIYPKICKKRLADNDIVVFLTYYEPIDDVLMRLENAGIDVDLNRRKGNLIVADAADAFFGNGKDILRFLIKLERQIEKIGKNNVSIIVSMSVFTLYAKEEEMIEYEGLFNLSETRNWKVLCCYHKSDYENFSERTKEELKCRHNKQLFCT
jgi:hypothetical protein